VALADTYFQLGETRSWPSDKALQLQKDATQKALALDDSLGDAHLELARTALLQFDLATADREFKRALELNSNPAHVAFAKFLAQTGRKEEAITEAKRGLDVDPLDRFTQGQFAWVHWILGMNDEAWDEYRKFVGEAHVCFVCADILVQRGRYQEAIAEWDKATVNNTGFRGHLAQSYVKAGRVAEARRILAGLESLARSEKIGAYEAAFLHAALGETDEAFRWLDTAFEQRDAGLLYLKTDHLLDPLRSDPRFTQLLRRVGLPL
jgi:tetratricopeptide (TPR) repeat protein